MIVIPIEDRGKLVKGKKYKAEAIKNSGSNQWGEGTVYIKGFSRYPVKIFVGEDGNEIPKIDYSNYSSIEPSTLKVGDLMVCKSDRFKNLISGNIYRIEDIRVKHKSNSWRKWSEYYLKFEGYSRYILFNNWKFKILPTDETREIALSSVLENKEFNFKVNSLSRKIDLSENKEKDLLIFLSRSICDPKRRLDAIDWACEKMKGSLGIKKEDYDPLLNLTLKEILEIVNQE